MVTNNCNLSTANSGLEATLVQHARAIVANCPDLIRKGATLIQAGTAAHHQHRVLVQSRGCLPYLLASHELPGRSNTDTMQWESAAYAT